MHLFVNGVAASAGGGLTYLRNVLPELGERSGIRATVALSENLQQEFRNIPNISCVTLPVAGGAIRRFWLEQTRLRVLIKQSGAEVLISAGNFALRRSPVPQILLSGNSLYTSKDFFRDVRKRGEYLLVLDTLVKGVFAKRSMRWADCTVAPSAAFAGQLQDWSGVKVRAIHHGFDAERFERDESLLPQEVRRQLELSEGALRLLFVSHYNYYRNFETLFRAIPLIQERMGKRPVRLFLTCRLRARENPGPYKTESAAALVRELKIGGNVIELGAVPYEMLHGLYRSCDIYTTAAYTETFAHPLVEAMACGLPVMASDLPVHREVCGDAGLYFERFSAQELADTIVKLAGTEETRRALSEKGLMRSRDFSWSRHVDEMLAIARELQAGR